MSACSLTQLSSESDPWDPPVENRQTLCRLLTELNFSLDEEEATAEILLKAFDLSLRDPDVHRLSTPSRLDPTGDSFTDLPLSRSQNPFLSTPMRLKHFPRLSPSILRGLLRSPSLRRASLGLGDVSLDNVSHSEFALQPLTSPCENAKDIVYSPSLPLTPPPSGRIPSLSWLPDPDPGKLQTLPNHEAPSVMHTADNFSANFLVSPTTVRNFQRVIDEMKGVDFCHEGTNDCSMDDHGSGFLSSSDLLRPLEGLFVAPEIDALPDSPAISLTIDRTLGALEEEFVGLLYQRANEEEMDAKELRELANRMERIGKGRRNLAAVIVQRRNGH
ncbi:hypothetical protein C8R43DRAFT_1137666 [Mycena crocata]|nr:hypothetical protein C8R43DRAFT_1137666 [Mycena crocata]